MICSLTVLCGEVGFNLILNLEVVVSMYSPLVLFVLPQNCPLLLGSISVNMIQESRTHKPRIELVQDGI